MIIIAPEILARAAACMIAIVLFTRLNGLRSFSKMSSFDFAVTVAFGSVIASAVISPDETVLYGIVALAALFAVQACVAILRVRIKWIERVVDNQPLLLMESGHIVEHNLTRSRVSKSDLIAKLREANVFDMQDVHAVVFESTGDISVLHAPPQDGKKISEELLEDVCR